jgi:hypothetical protein
MSSARTAIFLTPLLLSAAGAAPPADRIAQIAAWLPAQPSGLGRPAADRAVWDALAASPLGREVRGRGQTVLAQPLADQPDELFLEFSRNGNRTRWQDVAFRRRGRLTPLVLAECVEHKGRFLPAIDQLVAALDAEHTWVMPAHDGKLENFHGQTVDIDLASSALGWHLATAAWLLSDELSAKTKEMIAANLKRRITDPYRAMALGQRPANWWVNGSNNWNAVCHAGVVGTALASLDDRADRALFVAAAEQGLRHFLGGFTSDGYCEEGLGYWNYGFGEFVLLAETLAQATAGRLDLLADPAAKGPATFAARLMILNGVYPAFADCPVNPQPSRTLMGYLNRRFDLGLADWPEAPARDWLSDLPSAMIGWLPNSLAKLPPSTAKPGGGELRSWFDQAEVLVVRPAAGSACKLAAALKGGLNTGSHNHLDVGSYVVVVDDAAPLVDPGGEVYTARTFSSHRWESTLLNSFGHAVPRVAGVLQKPGADARAKVLATEFTPETDTYRLDITSCYPVKELIKVERAWTYSRVGEGALTVADHVEFTSPQSFGTALITIGQYKQLDDHTLLVRDGGQTAQVVFASDAGEVKLTAEPIKEETPVHPIRLGLDLTQPVKAATITCVITPAGQLPGENAGGLLRDGGFELGDWYWTLNDGGMSSSSDERAAEGRHSLKIVDRDQTKGSSATSAKFPVEAGRRYVLRGKVWLVSGSGIGLYVFTYDHAGKRTNPPDERGNDAPVGTLGGAVGQWVDFEFPFTPPAGSTKAQVWIHSFNSAVVEAYLDSLAVTPAPR